MRSMELRAGGLRWQVEDWGEADRPTVLFLHGFTGAAAPWHPIAGLLSDMRRLLPDLPGHRSSQPPLPPEDWSLERLAAALCDLLDSAGAQPVSVIGYSMGGRAALHLALHAQTRIDRLMLIGTSPGLPSERQRRERLESDLALAAGLESEGIERFVDEWEELPIFATQRRLPSEIRSRIRAVRLSHDPVALAAALRAFGTGAQAWLEPELARLTMPVCLVAGEEDRKYRELNERMEYRIPKCSAVIVPGAGHAVPVECPVALADQIRWFVGNDPLSPDVKRGEKGS